MGLENNFKVRETGLKAHLALVKKVGRNLAPYLRTLSGPWLILIHDSDKSCSDLANDALIQAIPVHKHVGTWSYCKTQVIEFIQNRLSQTPQSLCTFFYQFIFYDNYYYYYYYYLLLLLLLLLFNLYKFSDLSFENAK